MIMACVYASLVPHIQRKYSLGEGRGGQGLDADGPRRPGLSTMTSDFSCPINAHKPCHELHRA